MAAHQLKHTEYTLHINSIAGYWSTFRAVLHTAYREHKILENPNGFLERIDTIPTEKEHLSRQELVNLANTPCSSEVLKKALGFARPFSRSAESMNSLCSRLIKWLSLFLSDRPAQERHQAADLEHLSVPVNREAA